MSYDRQSIFFYKIIPWKEGIMYETLKFTIKCFKPNKIIFWNMKEW